jgi:hypothetical protein
MTINGKVYCPALGLTVPQRDAFKEKAQFFSGEDADLEASRNVFEQSEVKECYHNCFLADVGGKYDYYEGWCFSGVMPVAHAWLVDENGHVIDPTLVMDVEGTYGGEDFVFADRVQKSDYVGMFIPRKWLNHKVLLEKKTGGFLAEYLTELSNVGIFHMDDMDGDCS